MPPLIVAGAAIGAAVISSNAQKQAAKNAEDLAREQQGQALAEQKRLEEKYGLTPGELAREQRLFGIPEGEEAIRFLDSSIGLEPSVQKTLEERAGMTGEELLRSVGPDTANLLNEIAARQGKTGEELFREEGAIPQALADQVLNEVQNPEKFYQDTLNKKLELARQMVNQEANRRGVFGGTPEGGIRFEQLGRAGVDLAIKSASESMAQRQQALSNASQLATQFQSLSGGARSEAGTVAERALSEKTGARNELTDFLQLMEQSSAAAKGRVSNVAMGASAQAGQQTGQVYSNLIGIEGYKGNIVNPIQAGLSAIGQVGADYLGQNLPSTKVTTPTSIDPNSYEYLKEAGSQYDPEDALASISGSKFTKKKTGFGYK